MPLTEPLLAQHGITWFTGFAFSCGIDGSNTEGVLLLLRQSRQAMLQVDNTIGNTDPFNISTLEELNDIGLDLGTAIVLGFGPQKED